APASLGKWISNCATFFGDALLKTTIPRNVKVAEAPSHGVPVTQYARFLAG
ncbi:chromosome partitioning protein, partial [Halomonas sp. SUBG004]